MRGEGHPSHPRQDLRSNDRSPHPPKGREMRECAPSARSKRERVRGWRRPVEVADPPPAFPRRPTVALLWPGYVRVASGISCGGVGEQPGIRLLARAREGRGYCLCSGSAPPGTRATRYYGWMGVSWRPPGGFFSTSPMSFHRTVTPGTTIAPPSWGEPVSTFLFLKKKLSAEHHGTAKVPPTNASGSGKTYPLATFLYYLDGDGWVGRQWAACLGYSSGQCPI